MHVDFGEVAEHADQPLTVIEKYRLAVEEVVADEDDLACRWCLDRRATVGGEIQARMWVAFLAIEEAAQTEGAGQRAVDWPVEQQVAWLAWAELLVGAGLLGQFALDTFEVLGVGGDLLLILDGDALLGVVLAAHLKAECLTARDLYLLSARFDAERDADNGDPALAVFTHGQHRLALITHLGRLRRVAQIDHRHATWHRFVQQAGDETFGVGG